MPEIDVVNTDPLLNSTFDGKEDMQFDAAIRNFRNFYNLDALARRLDDGLVGTLRKLALDAKARFGGAKFDGTFGKGGFGMQPIHIRDVNHTNIHDWNTSGWTAGWREWLGNVGPNGGAAGATFVHAKGDVTDDFWHTAAVGVVTEEIDPVFQMIRPMMQKKEIGDYDVRSQFKQSREGYVDFGKVLYHVGQPMHNFGYGVRIRGTVAAAQHLQLVGVTFGTASRLFQTGVNDREVARTG